MKITRIHIENFGILQNLDVKLNENLNQICKPNGWGKSTLCAFLKAMFFGMEAKLRSESYKKERSKFMPWQGGVYGGYIDFIYKNQSFRLTRSFGKTPESDSQEILDLQTMKTLDNPNCEIGELIFGVGRETFEITAYFPQLNFLPSKNDEIKASLTGANKFENDQTNLDKAIKKIDAKITEVKRSLCKKEDLDNIKIAINQNIACQNLQRENYKKLQKEIEASQNLCEKNDLILQSKTENNKKAEEKLNQKRVIENNLRIETEKLNNILMNQSNKVETEVKPKNKAKMISFVCSFILLAVAVALCFIKLVVGLALGGVSILLLIFSTFLLKGNKKVEENSPIIQNGEDIDIMKEKIQSLKSQLENFSISENSISETQSLMSSQNALKIDLATKRVALQNLEREINRLEQECEKLEEDCEAMENSSLSADEKMHLLKLTKQFLEQSQDNVSKRYVAPINEEFENLFKEFNFGKSFVVDSELAVKENTNYGQKEMDYSSQGIRDILSFCQRVNLVKKVYQKEKPFLVLDDTFVNLDDEKMEVAKSVVKDIAKDYQVLYICCNTRCKI